MTTERADQIVGGGGFWLKDHSKTLALSSDDSYNQLYPLSQAHKEDDGLSGAGGCFQKKPVIVREVWKKNIVEEFYMIHQVEYPYASIDTEFPGPDINRNLPSQIPSIENYYFMKLNVDHLKLIQLGLTLSGAQGKLPDFGTNSCYVWEFNFCDFDLDSDNHNPDSINLLKRQGIDFSAVMLSWSGLNFRRCPLTWVTASNIGSDIVLNVDRVAGKSQQAGSDSLLTMQTFLKLRNVYFNPKLDTKLNKFDLVLFGLEVN
ncbi:probable CCR4-associated factor 1 homolog 11 [Cornus florida]|uniref:probable CCR4-associated factor 1 homolog 11 n=1 Tax=Cornus florida TaxID=4283 RepID=UPI00289A06E3|nr:probable CCR4-associated factor 1 homolog 11 [Cornus florida]